MRGLRQVNVLAMAWHSPVRYCASGAVDPTPFSLIILPTPYYTSEQNGGTAAMMNSQMQWIVDKLGTRNIVWVDHVGDCTDHGDDFRWKTRAVRREPHQNPLTTFLPMACRTASICRHDQSPERPGRHDQLLQPVFLRVAFRRGPARRPLRRQQRQPLSLFSTNGLNFIVISISTTPPDASVPGPTTCCGCIRTAGVSSARTTSSHWAAGLVVDAGRRLHCAKGQPEPVPDGVVTSRARGVARHYQGHTVHGDGRLPERTNGGNGWLRIADRLSPDT
jgi:hypothetical protein